MPPGRVVYVPTGESAESAGYLWDYGPIELVENNAELQPFESRFRPLSAEGAREFDLHLNKRRKRDTRHLQITVDATLPMRELVRQLEKRVELHRRRYADVFSTQSQPSTRRRLDQYPLYLEVWNLRSRGNSFAEIARKMYASEYAGHPPKKNPLVQRVMDQYERARQLINGGYKDLR